MSTLFLVEIVPNQGRQPLETLSQVDDRIRETGAQLIEAQVTSDAGRIFTIIEADTTTQITDALDGLDAAEVSDPARVRLVGADLDEIKAARPEAGYLVEWDIPASIDMDTYLARKKAKSPLYANVPEVSFLRTYVREDMAKCLCFYDGPDTEAIERARDAVSTPIDRLHTLVQLPAGVEL